MLECTDYSNLVFVFRDMSINYMESEVDCFNWATFGYLYLSLYLDFL